MTEYYISDLITSSIDMDNNRYNGFNYFPVDCSSGNITIALPTDIWNGLSYAFNRIDNSVNTLTFTANSGTVGGGSSITLAGKSYCEFVNFNEDWIAPRVAYI